MYDKMFEPNGLNLSQFGWKANFYSTEDIQKIISFCNTLPRQEGQLMNRVEVGGVRNDNSFRASSISWIPQTESNVKLYKSIGDFVKSVNDQLYKFDISGFTEPIQFSEYPKGAGYYDWHMDTGPNTGNRKLSVVIQLSSPDEYEGGDFEVMNSKNVQVAPKDKGTAIIFPSYILHRVTPVTKGVRKSLAVWISGPRFK